MATQLGNASVLESWCDFHNTSPVAWELYAGRVYFWNKKEVGRKQAPLKDDKGNPVIRVSDDGANREHIMKTVIHCDTRRIAMGNCACKHAGPVGLECNICTPAYKILITKTGDLFSEKYLWSYGDCINPFKLAQLVHPQVFFNFCIHDGKENPLCATLAVDTWWSDIGEIMTSRNKVYEDTMCAGDLIRELIKWGSKIDIELCADVFQCNEGMVRQCIATEGLKSYSYERQYDIMFGENAWKKGNGIEIDEVEEKQEDILDMALRLHEEEEETKKARVKDTKRKRLAALKKDKDDSDFGF